MTTAAPSLSELCTVILCAGSINAHVLPVGTNRANAMIPISGKPVIGWLLDDLLRKQITRVTIAHNDPRLRQYVERVYGARLTLTLVHLPDSRSILHSLRAGLDATPSASGARVILGDTLIQDTFDDTADSLYVGQVDTPRNWCIVQHDAAGQITAFFDKRSDVRRPGLAAAGYYHLDDAACLRMMLDDSIAAGETEFSAVLTRYMAHRPLTARRAEAWFDFGHIDNLVDARYRLLRPRHFNSVSLDSFSHTITKRSQNNDKLRDELQWYLDLPKALQMFTPRLLDYGLDGEVHFTQEFYGYPTLAELYLFSDLAPDAWMYSILRTLMRIHAEFRRYPGEVSADEARAVYLGKTFQRLDDLLARSADDPDWRALLTAPTLVHNGTPLRNVAALRPALTGYVDRMIARTDGCIVHGDFCFSNILFDINNLIVRLIDPRGSFGRPGIYGDPRYDMAKLRHSIHGCYDYIISDLFRLRQDGDHIESAVYTGDLVGPVAAEFDRLLADAGYDVDEIRFIEGLLFVSMVPLHGDHPQRQKLMYLTGLEALNQVV